MFESPPRESQFVSWSYVSVWSLIIFVTIPFSRAIQGFVCLHLGCEAFTYFVFSVVILVIGVSVTYFRRLHNPSYVRYIWLVVIAAAYIGYTIELRKVPEEAIHFVQYGALGVLVYRALTHRLKDTGIYLAAALICAMVGIVDEMIQWITPKRYWDLRDIWLNLFSGSMVQIGIAMAFNPSIISGWPNRTTLRFICRLIMVMTVMMGVTMMNTPERIAWYSDRLPLLKILIKNGCLMVEYGHQYYDPDIGVFRSRLTLEALKKNDKTLGEEYGKIIDRVKGRAIIEAYFETYTPFNDPFFHEALVHLFRRDQYFSNAMKCMSDPQKYAEYFTIAFRENQILEKYFSCTIRHSTCTWSDKKLNLAQKHFLQHKVYYSAVSKSLITRLNEKQVGLFFSAFFLGQFLFYCWLGRSKLKLN